MSRLRTLTVDPVVRSSSKLLARAVARVTARMTVLGQALDGVADATSDVVDVHATRHIQEQYHACCRALDELKFVLDSCGPPIEWDRMPPHMASLVKELIGVLVAPPRPAKARLKARIIKGTFLLVVMLADCL